MKIITIYALVLLLFLSSCTEDKESKNTPKDPDMKLRWELTSEQSAWVEETLNNMTLEDKIGQLIAPAIGPSFTEKKHYNLPQEFLRTCDVLSEDIYPIPDGKRKEGQGYNQRTYLVGEHTEKLVDLGSVNGAQQTPIWMAQRLTT